MSIKNCSAAVQRMVYVNWKSTWMTTVATYDWYWTAIWEESKLFDPASMGKAFILKITQNDVDIRDGDEVIIESNTYSVSGVSHRKGGNLYLTTALLNLNQEDATS